MKRLTLLVSIFFSGFIFLFLCTPSFAQQSTSVIPHDVFMKAQLVEITNHTVVMKDDLQESFQLLKVKILDGAEKDKVVSVQYDPQQVPGLQLYTGDTVVIAKVSSFQQNIQRYYFVDNDRQLSVLFVLVGFLLLIMLIAGWKGVGSILGLVISLGVIFVYIVPQIISGADPLTVCMIGAIGILFTTTYIAHGISKQTTIALVSTLLALFITFFLAKSIAQITLLNGYGDQEAVDLHFGLKKLINIKDLLLGGIILATLGALNDITITQAAAIFTLHKTSPQLSLKQLAGHGFAIGREHGISLVNTLVLAYAGSALSLFIFFLYNPNSQPLWVILNSEFLNEEVVKIIAGTSGLLLSIPIATYLTAWVCKTKVFGYIGDFIYAFLH